jgi:GNAT superfamily N-acetyltransferase
VALQTIQAATPEQLAIARGLFEEYAAWLAVDLSYQGFAAELESLPGVYAPPRGRLLLAYSENEIAGCVALRPLAGHACEMKRLFVRPAFRRRGYGAELARRIIAEARSAGHTAMKLDTLAHMAPAIQLYESLGFKRCAPYYSTPLENTVFMELAL